PAAEINGNIVPVMEVREDGSVRLGIGRLEVRHGLIGEHHAPAEGVVGTVALVDLDARLRQRLAQQDAGVESGRAATHADNSSHTGRLSRGAPTAPVRRMLYFQLLQVSTIFPATHAVPGTERAP